MQQRQTSLKLGEVFPRQLAERCFSTAEHRVPDGQKVAAHPASSAVPLCSRRCSEVAMPVSASRMAVSVSTPSASLTCMSALFASGALHDASVSKPGLQCLLEPVRW